MKFTRIKFSNYRCFLDGEIDFTLPRNCPDGRNIILFSAENGGGKTQLMFAFRFALYGLTEDDFKNIQGQAKTAYSLNQNIYEALSSGRITNSAEAKVELSFAYDGNTYTVCRTHIFHKTPTGVSSPVERVILYVQDRMGLPSFGPYESVEILQNKDRFRAFLLEHGFNTPKARGFSSVEEALSDLDWYEYPVIVKPTDSAGSKGVTRVDDEKGLLDAVKRAFEHSISRHIIVEEFIEKKGCSSDTDCFSVDGKLKFVSFSAQRFDTDAANPYTPSAYSWPATFSKDETEYLTGEIQRLISLLGMKTLVYNIETRVGTNGKPYIMELTPRGGGNRLCEMLKFATGVDMITAVTRAMVGDPIDIIEQRPYNGHWAEVILHAEKDGIFCRLDISREVSTKVIEEDLWIHPGDQVKAFNGANDAIGTLVLRFDNSDEMEKAIVNQKTWLKVVVE